MILKHGLNLAYCTNIHRGETWREVFNALKTHAMAVRDVVCPGKSFAIGLRLGNLASQELSNPKTLLAFQRWLDRKNAYVFTINGFPFGQFHGTRVKEQVYSPDWTSPQRLEYTNRLLDLLARLLPAGMEGSVSTVPGSFKDFITSPSQERQMFRNLWKCIGHMDKLRQKTGRSLHLGLEPEPLGWIENTRETIAFFRAMEKFKPGDERLKVYLGVNYDACHFALQFEDPSKAITGMINAGLKISKLHLSSALRLNPSPRSLKMLRLFADDVYLHQVICRHPSGRLSRFRDLPGVLDSAQNKPQSATYSVRNEWRVHFHVPLHAHAIAPFHNTNDHLLGVLDLLGQNPGLCSHLEMETYTWAVLPSQWRSKTVEEQLAAEYRWTLGALRQRNLA